MEITVAKSAGFCFGVQRAVDSVYKELEENSGKIYTFGPIIHNEQVVEDLNKRGIEVIDTVEQLKKIKEGTVVIRSHGVAKEIYDILEKILKDIRKGLNQFEYEKSDAYNLSFSILYYEKTKHDFKYIFNPSNISKERMFKYLYTTIILYKKTNGILWLQGTI